MIKASKIEKICSSLPLCGVKAGYRSSGLMSQKAVPAWGCFMTEAARGLAQVKCAPSAVSVSELYTLNSNPKP